MSSARWQLLKQVFQAASDLPPGERKPFLDERCAGDPELRAEVDELLRSAAIDDSFLEPPIATETLLPGEELGPYRIEQRIGSGGMSDVYLASRVDGAFEQRVAVKVLRQGSQDQERRRRFQLERELLARLDHIGIARILDGGTTAGGRPYLVMEHVDGRSLDAYRADAQPPLRQRLELFLRICEAVSAAHRSLIVHRDIKPSNILVTAAGLPKLLDFGIAAWTADDADDASELASNTSGFLTPEYASPEQVRGEPLTTATDVYSLGVLLCELLSGQRPHRFDEPPTRREIERVICEVAPRPPSEVTGSGGVPPRALRGDLDSIVLRAVRKSPSDRYASVEQLGRDIRRFLDGFPVSARPTSLAERFSMLVLRHRATTVAIVFALLILIGGVIATATQARRASSERDEARARLVEAEQLTAYLIELFSLADPAESRGESAIDARALLDRGAEQIASLDGQPRPQARLLHTMGIVSTRLALYDEAQRLLEQALELKRSTLGEEHPEVADSLDALSHLEHLLGRNEAAELASRRALSIRRAIDDPSALARTLSNLSLALEGLGRFDDAEPLLREAFAVREASDAPAEEIGNTLNNLGGILYRKAELGEAEEAFRRALTIAEEAHEPPHPDIANRLNNVALVLHARGELGEAEPLYQEALAQSLQLYGEKHPLVAQRHNNLAGLALQNGDAEAAAEGFRRALDSYRDLHGDTHPMVATATSNLAMAEQALGDSEEAEALYREAVGLQEEMLGGSHPDLAVTLGRLGQLLVSGGRGAEAVEPLRRAEAILEPRLGDGHWQLADTQLLLGQALLAADELEEAEDLLLAATEVLRSRFGPKAPPVREALRALVSLYETKGDTAKAAEYRQLLEK